MSEVCSTTLPQTVLPKILGHVKYQAHLKRRREKYDERAKKAVQALSSCKYFKVVKPKGAFYLSVAFTDEFVGKRFKLKAKNWKAQRLLDSELRYIKRKDFDKRFCYQMLAATGICLVPLSTGFNSYVSGFRMTLLESDEELFEQTLKTIVETVESVKI
jgi:aspartate/methionine/tyrosine aminotransferase